MKNIIIASKTVFKNHLYLFLAASSSLNLLAIYYFLFYRITTLDVFLKSNTALYNWLSIGMTLLISLFFGIAVSFLVWQWREKKENNPGHTSNTFFASLFGAISAGCPVCGAVVASLLGIGGGLAAFPFQGLEIKLISLGLFGFAIFSSAKAISSKDCPDCETAGKKRIKFLRPAALGIFLFFLVILLPSLADKLNFKVSFQSNSQANILASAGAGDPADLLAEINPTDGYTINAIYGDIGPQLLAAGAIDFNKIKTLYEQAGQPLTEAQIKILTEGSDEKIKISPENSYFLLNFLWAAGLANKNLILDEGPMMKYGEGKIGSFASTGGWTLGTKEATELYSKYEIISLDSKQQAILDDFAYNSYRPCCSNPTGFPDCNHGMAALGLGEIMAAQGASVDEIFEAFKYVNAFWFPQTYFDVAAYFKAKEGKDWSQVNGRTIAGKDYSTPQGWQRVRQWLSDNNLIEKAPSSGGGCGV